MSIKWCFQFWFYVLQLISISCYKYGIIIIDDIKRLSNARDDSIDIIWVDISVFFCCK